MICFEGAVRRIVEVAYGHSKCMASIVTVATVARCRRAECETNLRIRRMRVLYDLCDFLCDSSLALFRSGYRSH